MPGYNSSSSESTSVTIDPSGRVTVTGRLCFSYSAEGTTPAERADYLSTMARRGWKIGVQLRPGQNVERFSFAGTRAEVVLRPDSAVTSELEAAFPCPGGEMHWFGFLPGPGERRYTWEDGPLLTICYDFTLVFTNGGCLPQAIVIALTYASGDYASFLEHYLLHVILITDIPGAQSSVSAIVDVKKRRIARPAKPSRSARSASKGSPAKPPARRKSVSKPKKGKKR
jgi:hypothetical protein